MTDLFKSKKKGSTSAGRPEFTLLSEDMSRPVAVIEAKASPDDLSVASAEARAYGDDCDNGGHLVLAIGVAGQDKTSIRVSVEKRVHGSWKPVVHNGVAITWIPTPQDVEKLLASADLIDLAPTVPSPDVLATQAEKMNRILRETDIHERERPAYVGAMMLAVWETHGGIRRATNDVLGDMNRACERAFKKAKKPELASSLHIDEANSALASRAWEILAILEKLHVSSALVEHDYLGQLYETFFRYSGGNTIGQYFTPRHIARFMADLCSVTDRDKVIDPACGTGGFLIACLQRVCEVQSLKYEDTVRIVKKNLRGYESEPLTAALCVANMILRGDGTTGIQKADCLTVKKYPTGKYDIALMNPPFPHKQTDTPVERFVDRALEALHARGQLAVILPTSALVKREKAKWRKRLLAENTLVGVCELPDELFQPYASATTSIVILERGVPHSATNKAAFVRVSNDGFVLKKRVRRTRIDGSTQLPKALTAISNKKVSPGFSGVSRLVEDSWSVGAYIPSTKISPTELRELCDDTLRSWVAFYSRYASQIARQRQYLAQDGAPTPMPYRDMLSEKRADKKIVAKRDELAHFFDIYYGQKELHARGDIERGSSLIISPKGLYNGCYGWLEFDKLIDAPFVTTAQTGSIGESFIQTEPCGVNDDCLILLPKPDQSFGIPELVIAAATIRAERWRFNYGRKLTPERIASFKYTPDAALIGWVRDRYLALKDVAEAAVAVYLKEVDPTA